MSRGGWRGRGEKKKKKQDDKERGREVRGQERECREGAGGRDVVISFSVSHSGGNDLPNLTPARHVYPRHRQSAD